MSVGAVAPDPRRWRVLALVGAAFFMTILDVAIVNVALPSIARDLEFSRDNLQWVITAYAIVFGGFLLLGGRAADLLGRRTVFMVGVTLFTLASLACGLASEDWMLIVARAVQGLGAAIISPAALSIVMTSFEEGPERNKALGVWGALGGSGAAVGVLLGGILTRYLGWEWIFLVNVPVGAVVVALSVPMIRETRVAAAERRYDPFGAVTITAALVILVYAISEAPDVGWGAARTIVLLGVSAALVAAFVAIELRSRAPLVPLGIFRVRTLLGANVVAIMLAGAMFAMFFLLTLYVQQVLDYSALEAGLTFLATAGTAVLSAGIAQALVTRVGVKPVMAVGLGLLAAANLWYTQISVDGTFQVDLLPGYIAAGIGIAFSFIPVSVAALAGIGEREAGLASGLINTSQQIGGAIGVAVASTIFTSHFESLLRGGEPPPAALTGGFQWAFWVVLGIAAAGLLAVFTLIRREEIPVEETAALPVG